MYRSLLRLCALTFLALSALGGGLAHAQAGVGIDPGEISGLPPIVAGESVTVAVQVRNPGTAPASYEFVAQPLDGVPESAPDAEWFTFEPSTVQLDGGEQAEIEVVVKPPAGTTAGNYLALLTAQLVLPDDGSSGARVGAAVATKFYFTVAVPADPGSLPVWPFVAGAALFAVVGGAVLVKRSGFRLKVERSR